MMQKGNIIILNGVSSAGKTTLAKTLQGRLNTPYFHMDIDMFSNMAPEKFYDDYSVQGNFVSNMFHAVKLFSDLGFNLVVPAFLDSDFLQKPISLLHAYPVLFVHVTCPDNELRRREIERGDRKIGAAETMLPMLAPKNTYDVEVDTCKFSLEECADKIIALTEDMSKHTAFQTLWLQYKANR